MTSGGTGVQLIEGRKAGGAGVTLAVTTAGGTGVQMVEGGTAGSTGGTVGRM